MYVLVKVEDLKIIQVTPRSGHITDSIGNCYQQIPESPTWADDLLHTIVRFTPVEKNVYLLMPRVRNIRYTNKNSDYFLPHVNSSTIF